MVEPPRPWPKPPPRNHSRFQPEGLAQDSVSKDSMSLFFCNGLTPKTAAYRIMEAVVQDDHAKLRTLLSDPQNLPDFTNHHGVSPVMVAAARGNMMVLEMLAAHPLVNLSRQSPDGWTALHYAAHLEKPLAVTTLLKHYTNFTLGNKMDEIAFDLAKNADVEEAFWAHKDFTRYMKKLRPTHARFAPKVTQAAAPAPENPYPTSPYPAEDKLRLDFVAAAAKMAMEGSSGIRHSITQEIIKQLPRLTVEEFKGCCDALQKAENDHPKAKTGFDWSLLFIETAKSGRADLIATLAADKNIEDQKTLNEALYQCIRQSDAPEAVMVLLQLGADATAKTPTKLVSSTMDSIIAFKAVEARRPEAFRQICLWTAKLPHWEKNKEKIQYTMQMWRGRAFDVNDPTGTAQIKHKIVLAMEMHDIRRMYHTYKEDALFKDAQDIQTDKALPETKAAMQLAAIYAEVMQSPRRKLMFSREGGANMMTQFLKSGDTVMAQRMVNDGYHLAQVQNTGAVKLVNEFKQGMHGKDVQDFVTAHLQGTLVTYTVESPEDKMRALKEIAARTPHISSRGIFGF